VALLEVVGRGRGANPVGQSGVEVVSHLEPVPAGAVHGHGGSALRLASLDGGLPHLAEGDALGATTLLVDLGAHLEPGQRPLGFLPVADDPDRSPPGSEGGDPLSSEGNRAARSEGLEPPTF